jgi:phage tail-like protein
MVITVEQQATTYPLPAYNFRVSRAGQTMRFAKVSGLQREHKVLTYRDGLSFLDGELIARYHLDQYVSVTLEQGVVQGENSLHDWLEAKDLQAMEVQLCNAKGVPVLAWRMARTIPIKITAPNFDAKSNEVAIDVMEIKATGISIVPLS